MSQTWTVTIHLFDADDVERDGRETEAHAFLNTSSGTTLESRGRARRNPTDASVPEIGEELATARALRSLADQLLRTTASDISAVEHHRVRLPR